MKYDVKNDFQMYLMQSNRLKGDKSLLVVDTKRFDDFIEAVVSDTSIAVEKRLFIVMALSGGLRVSEALAVKRSDIDTDGYYVIKVLKKKRDRSRICRLHPKGLPLLAQLKCGDSDTLFTFSRYSARKFLIRLFGKKFTPHSLRHSFISWLLFSKKRNALDVSKIVSINVSTIEYYAHLNIRDELSSLFSE